jgi:hypothetical protein
MRTDMSPRLRAGLLLCFAGAGGLGSGRPGPSRDGRSGQAERTARRSEVMAQGYDGSCPEAPSPGPATADEFE